MTLLRRTPASSPKSECAVRHQQGHAGSKTMHHQNPPVLNWRCWIVQVDLHNGHKTVDVVVIVKEVGRKVAQMNLDFAPGDRSQFKHQIISMNLAFTFIS